MHEELTLMYNDPDAHLMDIHDAMGGCYQPEACQCGCAFCVGEMIGRLKLDAPLRSDSYFFAVNGDGAFCVNVHLVEQANDRFRDRYSEPRQQSLTLENMRMEVLRDMGDELKEAAVTPLHRDTLMNLFNAHAWKRDSLPVDRQAHLPKKLTSDKRVTVL